jgi:hypothetical protein
VQIAVAARIMPLQQEAGHAFIILDALTDEFALE